MAKANEAPNPTESAGSADRESIGLRVRRLRQGKGMSQDRLALASNVDQSGLSKFERGSRGLGEVPLRRIAAVLELSYEELIVGTDFGEDAGK